MTDFQYLDKRVQRTKLGLYDALFELLKQKQYVQITVKDIIDQAEYSRGTFYSHYGQKDDLIKEMIDFLIKKMIRSYRSSYIKEDSINVQGLVDEPLNFLKHFKTYGEYYQTLLSSNVQINFRQKLTDVIINLYFEDFEILDINVEKRVDVNLIKRYSAYGLTGLILDWIMDDFPIEPEVFSVELVKTFQYSLGIIQIKNKRS